MVLMNPIAPTCRAAFGVIVPQPPVLHLKFFVRNYWTHTSVGRSSPLIRANSRQPIEDVVRVILGFDLTQSLVILAIKRRFKIGLTEVGLGVIGQLVYGGLALSMTKGHDREAVMTYLVEISSRIRSQFHQTRHKVVGHLFLACKSILAIIPFPVGTQNDVCNGLAPSRQDSVIDITADLLRDVDTDSGKYSAAAHNVSNGFRQATVIIQNHRPGEQASRRTGQ